MESKGTEALTDEAETGLEGGGRGLDEWWKGANGLDTYLSFTG